MMRLVCSRSVRLALAVDHCHVSVRRKVGSQKEIHMTRPGSQLCCISVIVLLACGTESEPNDPAEFSGNVPSAESLTSPIELPPGRLVAAHVVWGIPAIIQPIGDNLLVGDPFWSPRFALVDLARDSIAFRFGQEGEGPGEFRAPVWTMVDSDSAARVWIYDSGTRRFTLVGLDASDQVQILDNVMFNPQEFPRQPVFTDSGYITNGVFADFTLLITDTAANELARVTVDPPFTLDEVPHPGGLRTINANRMAVRPGTNELALLYLHSPRIDFFTAAGAHRGTVRAPRNITTRFEIQGEGFRWGRDDQTAFMSVFGTQRYVYGFFCGCTIPEQREGKVPSIVQIYRWNGDFVCEIALERPIIGLAVSADDSVLYGGVGDPEPAVVEWLLPESLRGEGR
jgi:hypothetical protein